MKLRTKNICYVSVLPCLCSPKRNTSPNCKPTIAGPWLSVNIPPFHKERPTITALCTYISQHGQDSDIQNSWFKLFLAFVSMFCKHVIVPNSTKIKNKSFAWNGKEVYIMRDFGIIHNPYPFMHSLNLSYDFGNTFYKQPFLIKIIIYLKNALIIKNRFLINF